MEYEIKLLGEHIALRKIFNYFRDAAQVKRNRNYAFNTYYLDTPDQQFRQAGYSFRHRTGVYEIDKQSGTELKALSGAIGMVSARLEIEQLGSCPRDNYTRLQSHPDWPSDAPKVDPMDIQTHFATSVRRVERQAYARIGHNVVMIEAALDDIAYLKVEERDGGLFNNLLMPYRTEPELEFELKTDCEPQKFWDWISSNVIRDVPIQVTKDSKAQRAFR